MLFLIQRLFWYILLFATQNNRFCVAYDPEASITGLYTGPYFDPLTNRNLTAHSGDEAVLPCTVRQLGDKSVSWVRMRDADILTVDRYTFVSDQRFNAYLTSLETWNLVIKGVRESDVGWYECQVSTEPKMSQLFNLRVVVPKVKMVPSGDRFVKTGSQVRLDCHITDVVRNPDYIFWYHNDVRVFDRLNPNLEIKVQKTGPETIVSALTINGVQHYQSGNYTCMPSNLHSSSAVLHVLIEEHQAAMQDGRNAATCYLHNDNILLIILLLVLYPLFVGKCSSLLVELPKEQDEMNKHTMLSEKNTETNLMPLSTGNVDSVVNVIEEFIDKNILFNEKSSYFSDSNVNYLSKDNIFLLKILNRGKNIFAENIHLNKIDPAHYLKWSFKQINHCEIENDNMFDIFSPSYQFFPKYITPTLYFASSS